MKVYLNGEVTNTDVLNEVLEPGFLFGWGAFETLRAYKSKPLFLDEHISRLNNSLELLELERPTVDFKAIIKELLKENNLEEAYIRISVYKKRKQTGVIVYTSDFGYYPKEAYEKGFGAVTSVHYLDTKSLSWKVKSLSYLEKRLAWYQAQKEKKDETLIRNGQGYIVGGSRSNLLLVKDKRIIIPSRDCGIFEGITMQGVLKTIEVLGFEVAEKAINLDDVFNCDEAFLTSSLLEVMPLVECDDQAIGKGRPGPITLEILAQYRKNIHE